MSALDPKSRAFEDLAREDARPHVAVPSRPWVMPFAVIGAVALGGVVFLGMTSSRTHADAAEPPAVAAEAPAPAPTPPAPVAVAEEPAQPEGSDRASRLAARAMIFDQSGGGMVVAANEAGDGAPPAAAAGEGGGGGEAGSARDVTDTVQGSDALGQGSNENYVARLGRAAGAARAVPPGDLTKIVPEGTVMPAVLETALNSDLPGFTRAVVSRDVRSFDGSEVLVPRGSRLIGQYRSAVALGQSRAFVVWTRLVRPDGVSVRIADPGADALGRGGLEGHVNTHFFRRFAGPILLTLLNAAGNAAASNSDTQVIIAGAQGLGTAASSAPPQIAPTVEVAQGTPIRIFVTRDIDFTGVKANAG